VRSFGFARGLWTTLCAFALVCPSLGAAEPRARLVQSVDVQIPMPPSPVVVAGKRRLVYELHITNFSTNDIELTSVTVFDTDRATQLVEYQGKDLIDRLGRPGIKTEQLQKQLLNGGIRAVMYMWLTLEDATFTPATLSHRIELNAIRATGSEAIIVNGGESPVANTPTLALSPPLRGGPWVTLYDPLMERGHRTSIYTLDGRARIPARYAIDFIRLENDATHARGDETQVANWHGFGAEVLAVADGVIVHAMDDMPTLDSIRESQGPTPLESASGNYVTLNLGDGGYAFYEHLQHGSIRVKSGDRVKTGQVLGLLGNSGSSSSGPHLHFHVANTPSTLAAEGVPYVFNSFEVVGAFQNIGDFATGEPWDAMTPSEAGKRKLELPDANVVLLFPTR
jgi:murein DD-endopeptidase